MWILWKVKKEYILKGFPQTSLISPRIIGPSRVHQNHTGYAVSLQYISMIICSGMLKALAEEKKTAETCIDAGSLKQHFLLSYVFGCLVKNL